MNVLFSIQQILLGKPLYSDPSLPPYSITQYMPLYYYVAASPALIAHVAASDVLAVASIARGVSLAIAIALAVVIYTFLKRRIACSDQIAFIATVFLMLATANWYFAVRPDGLATLLTLLAFYALTSRETTRRAVILASLLAVGAVFTKQNGLFAIIVLLLFLAYERRWRDAFIASASMLVAAVFSLVLMSQTGPAIKANVIDGINNGIAIRAALMTTFRPVFYWFAPLIAFGLVAAPRLLARDGNATRRLLGIAIIVSFWISTLSALKRGSAENYYNEFVILSVFAFVVLYLKDTVSIDRTTATVFQLYLVAFLMIRAGHQLYTTYLYHRAWPETRLTSQLAPARYACDQTEKGRAIIGFAVGLSNVCPDKMVFPERALADAAQRRNLVDYSHFDDDIRKRRIQFLVMPNGQAPQTFLRVDLEEFVPVRRFAYYTLYETKR